VSSRWLCRAVLVAALALLGACRRGPSPAAGTDAGPDPPRSAAAASGAGPAAAPTVTLEPLVPGQGLGELRLGSSAAAAEKLLGAPEGRQRGASGELLWYRDRGLALQLDAEGRLERILGLAQDADPFLRGTCAAHTREGLSLASSLEAWTAAFGPPADRVALHDPFVAPLERWRYPAQGLALRVQPAGEGAARLYGWELEAAASAAP